MTDIGAIDLTYLLGHIWAGLFLGYSLYLNIYKRHDEAIWAVLVAIFSVLSYQR